MIAKLVTTVALLVVVPLTAFGQGQLAVGIGPSGNPPNPGEVNASATWNNAGPYDTVDLDLMVWDPVAAVFNKSVTIHVAVLRRPVINGNTNAQTFINNPRFAFPFPTGTKVKVVANYSGPGVPNASASSLVFAVP